MTVDKKLLKRAQDALAESQRLQEADTGDELQNARARRFVEEEPEKFITITHDASDGKGLRKVQ